MQLSTIWVQSGLEAIEIFKKSHGEGMSWNRLYNNNIKVNIEFLYSTLDLDMSVDSFVFKVKINSFLFVNK